MTAQLRQPFIPGELGGVFAENQPADEVLERGGDDLGAAAVVIPLENRTVVLFAVDEAGWIRRHSV